MVEAGEANPELALWHKALGHTVAISWPFLKDPQASVLSRMRISREVAKKALLPEVMPARYAMVQLIRRLCCRSIPDSDARVMTRPVSSGNHLFPAGYDS